ncbi:MAG TPA: BsuPI-related putative proteinase inhibitor [bacterium]|nr:BsuPI-related putative proteinase inhibitor [bacterium]
MPERWLITLGAVVLTAAAGLVRVEHVEGPLRLSASLPHAMYGPGQPVEVALRVRNAGNAPVAITFSSGQHFDLVVRRPRGDEVWRWSHDKAFIQVFETATLKPGDVLAYEVAWDQQDYQGRRVDSGPYQAIAVFTGHVGTRRDIRLPPLEVTIGAQ